MKPFRLFLCLGLVALLLLLASSPSSAQSLVVTPCVTGTSSAVYVGSSLGDWKYTVDVSWGPLPHGVSHLNVVLGLDGCDCVCEMFPFGADDPAGSSSGPDSCAVFYAATFECGGDPSIPGDEGPLVKWEPIEGPCEPETEGSGTFVFYSDWPPAPAPTLNTNLMIKFSTDWCAEQLSGVLPECTCATSTESWSWERVKSLFR